MRADVRRSIDDIVAAFADQEALPAALDDSNAAVMGIGWAIRLCRTAEAVCLLYDADFGVEAAPLVRSVIEHAFRLQWLVEEQDAALELIEHQHRRAQRLMIEGAASTDWDLDELLEHPDGLPPSDLDLPNPSEGTVRTFEALMRRLGRSDWYLAYRLESLHSHPSYLSAAAYVRDLTEEGDPQFTAPSSHQPTPLIVVLTMLVTGLGSLGDLVELSPRLTNALDSGLTLLEGDS
jgi:hypothetical protein